LKWVEGLRGRKLKESRRPEDLAFRRVRDSLASSVVLQTAAEELGVSVEAFGQRRRNSALRALASRFLVRYAGQTQREVAALLGTSTGGAISACARDFEERFSAGPKGSADRTPVGSTTGGRRRAMEGAGAGQCGPLNIISRADPETLILL